MTTKKVTITRSEKASAIVQQGLIAELATEPGLFVVVDKASGSGMAHLASVDFCDCPDHTVRGSVCKHQLSVRMLLNITSCPNCNSPIESRQFYVGGKGYQYFDICSGNGEHVFTAVGGN